MSKTKNVPKYIIKNLSIVVGIVLIWRGVWYLLDVIDVLVFGGNHLFSSIVGIIAGVAILYFPDKNLRELSKL